MTFTCADTGGSGLTTASGNQTLADYTAETSGTTANFSGTCVDNAGNTAAASSFGPIKIDKTAPSVSPASVVDNVWRNSSLSQAFTASDNNGSGLAVAGDASFTLTASLESTKDADGNVVPTVVSKTVSDVAGNSTPRSVSALIDYALPALSVNGAASGTVYDICGTTGTPQQPSFAPSDALSGPAWVDSNQNGKVDSAEFITNNTFDSWTPNLLPSGVGDYTYYAQAKDIAGNLQSESRTYGVDYDLNYTDTSGAFSGVQQPINNTYTGATRSSFKLGSTIPVKFQLRCGTTPINNAVAKLWVSQFDSKPDTAVNEVSSTNSPDIGNQFRVTDTATGQYQFNLSTKSGYTNPGATSATSFSLGTWYLYVSLDDGSKFRIAIIDFQK